MDDEIKMVMERVRRDWVIRRLRDYPHLQNQIRTVQRTIRDLLGEAGGLRSPILSDMPHGCHKSDRTYKQVLQLPRMYEQLNDLNEEIHEIKSEVEQIDNAVRQLNPTERFVVESRYIKPVSQKQYRVLARTKGYAESTLKNAHTSAIKKIARFFTS